MIATVAKKRRLSESDSVKAKRGRPPVTVEFSDETLREISPGIYTRRGRQNADYRARAMRLVRYDLRCRWLYDRQKAQANEPHHWRPSILAELGRIPDDDVLLSVAVRLCELKPSAKESVAIVRRFRLGREPASNGVTLFLHLARALDSYTEARPSTSVTEQAKALRDLADLIEQTSHKR